MPPSVDDIAGRVYDGVLQPSAWHNALDMMCSRLGAGVFHYFTLDSSGAQVPASVCNLESAGLHAERMGEYETQHAGNDLRMAALLSIPMGRVMLDHEYVSSRDRERNAVYADWLIPLGLMHTAAATVRMEGDAQDIISFMRERDREPYSETDKKFLAQLIPHITRGARLRARIGQLSHHAAMGLAVLESLPQGMALVDAQCRIQYTNAAAERLLASPSAMGSVHGKLVCK